MTIKLQDPFKGRQPVLIVNIELNGTWSLPIHGQFLHLALSALYMLAASASAAFKSRASLQLEQ
jgi:hypothetical protein